MVAPYRESVGITDDKQAIGPMPLDRAEPREAWWASVRELELPDEAALMRAMGRGELEARVAEYERTRAAAPADVSRRLDAVSQVLLSAQQQAQAARLTGNADMEVSAQALDGDLAGEQSTLQVKQAVREEWAEASARPRPYPAMDPEVHAKLKAEQTARVEADRQERIEAAARQTPVFDGEMANTGMLRL